MFGGKVEIVEYHVCSIVMCKLILTAGVQRLHRESIPSVAGSVLYCIFWSDSGGHCRGTQPWSVTNTRLTPLLHTGKCEGRVFEGGVGE